jgi:hypothetical protein
LFKSFLVSVSPSESLATGFSTSESTLVGSTDKAFSAMRKSLISSSFFWNSTSLTTLGAVTLF